MFPLDYLFPSELIMRNPANLPTVLRMCFDSEMTDIMMSKRSPWALSVVSAASKFRPAETTTVHFKQQTFSSSPTSLADFFFFFSSSSAFFADFFLFFSSFFLPLLLWQTFSSSFLLSLLFLQTFFYSFLLFFFLCFSCSWFLKVFAFFFCL